MSNIIFIKLFVHDAEAMAAFYQDVLQLREKSRLQYPIARGVNKGIEVIEITLAPISGTAGPGFVLLQYLDNRPPVNGEVTIGLTTDDLDGVIARSKSAGGEIMHPPESFDAVGDDGQRIAGRLMVIADPEGHLTELVQVTSG